MEDYQELYENLTQSLKELNSSIAKTKIEKDKAELEYQQVNNDITNLKESLNSLQIHKEKLLYINDKKIEIIINIIMLISTILLLTIYAYLSLKITNILKIVASEALRKIIGFNIIISGLISFNIIKKIINKEIRNKLKERTTSKIINSAEYQKTLEKITKLKEEISLKEIERKAFEAEFKKVQTKYNHQNTDLIMKQSLVKCLDNKTKPKDSKTEKSYTRTKTKYSKWQ